MKHIKNTSSYISWILYAALLGIGLLCFVATKCEGIGISTYMAIPSFLGVIVACGGVTYLLYLLGHSSVSDLFYHPIAAKLGKTIGVMVLLTIGLYLRLQTIVHLGFDNSFHENALQIFASQESSVVHGITYLYLRLYLIVFQLFEAYAGTMILMEILLQLVFAFLLFLFLQKRIGYFCGLTAFGFLMCSPGVVSRMGTNSSEMLFLVLCVTVCFLISPAGEKERGFLYFLCSGILIGALVFFDVSALLLYVLLVSAALNKSYPVGVCVSSGIFGGIAGTITCMAIDASLSGLAFGSYFAEWIGCYYVGDLMKISFTPEFYVITACLIIGVFGFCFVTKQDTYSIMMLLLLVLFAKEYVLISKQISGNFVLYILLICFAGISLQSCFDIDAEQEEESIEEIAEETVEETVEETSMFDVPKQKSSTAPQVEKNEWVYGESSDGRTVKYIENPLPPPKRHVRRALEYPIPVTERNAEYDYAVSDDEDYDI